MIWPSAGLAHGSEAGFVLLLPTDVYTMAGVQVVALTFLLLVLMRDGWIERMFVTLAQVRLDLSGLQTATSLLSFAVMCLALGVGWFGSRDPLSNMLPLSFWTIGWVAVVCLSGIIGNLWLWLNPWAGLYRLIGAPEPLIHLPDRLGVWPASAMLAVFSGFLLAHPATHDPAVLASYLGAYWLVHMAGVILAGPVWLDRVEIATVLFGLYGRISPIYLGRDRIAIGGPGRADSAPCARGGVGGVCLAAAWVGQF